SPARCWTSSPRSRCRPVTRSGNCPTSSSRHTSRGRAIRPRSRRSSTRTSSASSRGGRCAGGSTCAGGTRTDAGCGRPPPRTIAAMPCDPTPSPDVPEPGGRPPAMTRVDRLLFLCFFASGASALVYEVVWLRWLVHLFGATTLAVSTILTAYMAGLALGSWLAGRWAAAVSRPLRAYGILELAIAAYALALPVLLQGVVPALRLV